MASDAAPTPPSGPPPNERRRAAAPDLAVRRRLRHLAEGVNRAIRDLIGRGRLNATSVMVVAPSDRPRRGRRAAERCGGEPRCAIGLHVDADRAVPAADHAFPPRRWRLFLPFPDHAARRACCGGSIAEMIEAELAAQLAAFKELFGRAPDFVDGHQHVQLFPQVRDGFLRRGEASCARRLGAPGRQACQPLAQRLGAPKALLLDMLSAQFRRRAARAGIPFNPAFAGAYDFSTSPDFGELMRQFLDGLPDGGLVMCHPGLCRRHAGWPRSADHAARGRTRLSRRRCVSALLAANNVTLG